MNKPAVALSIVAVGLVVALILSQRKAGQELTAAQTQIDSFSNRLAEAEMKVNHQEQMNAALGSAVTHRAEELTRAAGELAKARSQITQAQAETRNAQGETRAALAQLTTAQSGIDALSNQISELTRAMTEQEGRVRDARELQAAAEVRQQTLQQQLNVTSLEKDKYYRLLQDKEVLRGQIKQLGNLPPPGSSTNQVKYSKPDYRLPLELQPDGSVRLVEQQK
jgi:chromosome segregation ATPase